MLSDAQKQDLALDVLERFVPYAETFWRNSDLSQPRTGYYAAVGSGVTQPRGAGDIAFAYVTLLAARPDRAAFAGVTREVMIDHTIQSIRHEALTNALSGAGYNRWGKGTWQASLETFSWAFAAYRLWDVLDADTRALVQKVVKGEADILITKPMASGEEGDTGAEDNAWNSPTPALAAVMFPDDPNKAAWEESVIRLALNASSTSADASSLVPIDGKPLNQWISTVNLHPDLTMENHGFFNPIYQQVTHIDIGDTAIAYAAATHALPEALSFRTETVWTQLLARLATDDGDFAMPAGQDWTSKDYQHLDYLSILATRFRRADASVYESRALELVARRQATFPNGSMLGQPQIGYETMLIKRLAALWWNHSLFGPSPLPSSEEFATQRAASDGIKSYPYSTFIAGRLEKAFVSMSWDSARPMGLVIPHGRVAPDDPIFTYYAPLSLLGSASGSVGATNCACETNRFSTAGSVGTRRFSMTAFEDGTTLLLDRGQGSTFTYALDDIPGLTGPRPIFHEAGASLGTLSGEWVNAADRLGMIVRGGPGMQAASVSGGNRQIVITGATGTGTGNRGAMLLPLANHEQTAALDPFVTQPDTPTDWSALSGRAMDGTLRLAVARWGGPLTTSLNISDLRGAPVPTEHASLAAGAASFKLSLAAPASRGETMRYFVSATSPLIGYQQGSNAVLGNPNTDALRARVTYVASDGSEQVLERVLAAGEQVQARVLDGQTTLAGPELEPLLAARTELLALIEVLRNACGSHAPRHRHHHDHPGLEQAEKALALVERAIQEVRSTEPDMSQIAKLVERADRMLRGVAKMHVAGWSVTRAAESVRTKLEQAVEQGVAPQAWLEPNGFARPGEPLSVRVFIYNRGSRPLHRGNLSVSGEDGFVPSGSLAAFSRLDGGASFATTVTLGAPISLVPGEFVGLHADLEYRVQRDREVRSIDSSVLVGPLFESTLDTARLRLAGGGVNQVGVHLANEVDRPLAIAVSALPSNGITVAVPSQQVTLPPLGSLDLSVALAGAGQVSGQGTLLVTAISDTGVRADHLVNVAFTDNLALNDVGAPWPKPSATSNQAPFPPSLAFDGNTTTFWVSDGTVAGQGPSPTSPKMLAVDFGAAARIGSVVMVPRVNFGPRGYSIEVSNDGVDWSQVADVPNSPNATVTSTFTPVTTRMVRLRITGGYDRIQPPRNVQVAEFIVRAAP
ncbi:MAG: discoidin domain-containing protein [Myxococcota bacterium]